MQKLTCTTYCAAWLMLTGCVSNGTDTRLSVGEGVEFELLSPASFGHSLILTQVVSLDYGQQSQQLLFYSEINTGEISIAGLLPNGTRLFTIRYDGQTLLSEGSPAVLDRLDPHYLLADMQIALWPLAAVNASFESANPCFVTGVCKLQEAADRRQRTLVRNGTTIIEISYQDTPQYSATLRYEHRSRGYALQIETLNVDVIDGPPAQ